MIYEVSSALDKWINNLDAINGATWLQVFREYNGAGGFFGGTKHKGIPKRESEKSVEIDRREDIVEVGGDDIELGKQLDFTSSDLRVYAEFTRDRNKIFLEHL